MNIKFPGETLNRIIETNNSEKIPGPSFLEQKELYEKYKGVIEELKAKAAAQAVEYRREGNVLYIDCTVLGLLQTRLEKDGVDIKSSKALSHKVPYPGINDNANLLREYTHIDDSKALQEAKEVFLHQSIFSDTTRKIFQDRLIETISEGNPALNKLEALSYLGVTPESLEHIKKPIIESGDMILIDALCQGFDIQLNATELLLVAEKAYENESAYDLKKILDKMENPEQRLIEKKDQLIEKAYEKFVMNRDKILSGIANKDLLIHFSHRKNVQSILKHGIFSILEQRQSFDSVQVGAGPDMQTLLGRQDCVSVFNFYKGAEGDFDEKLYEKMKSQIQGLMYAFQEDYPERVFSLSGYGTSGGGIRIESAERDSYLKKFSRCIEISGGYSYYIDPTDKEFLSRLNVLVCPHNGKDCYIEQQYGGEPAFNEYFFQNMDTKKQKLLDDIKGVMKETYEISVNAKDDSHMDAIMNRGGAVQAFGMNIHDEETAAGRAVFILDPTLSKTFIMSAYFSESFVDEKIVPEKIMAMKLIDSYSEKECFNSGMVGFKVLRTKNATEEDLVSAAEKDVLLREGGVIVYTESPYQREK